MEIPLTHDIKQQTFGNIPVDAKITKTFQAELEGFKIVAGLAEGEDKVHFSVCLFEKEDKYKCITKETKDSVTYEDLKEILKEIGFKVYEWQALELE